MTLHESIFQTLLDADRPMTSKEVAEVLNSKGYSKGKDQAPLSPSQVRARISRFPQEFDYIHGEIILTQNSSWSDILRSHNYLQSLFRNLAKRANGTLVVFLLFYKRISDLSESRSEFKLPVEGRVNSLRNNVTYLSSRSFLENLHVGIKYFAFEFKHLRHFFDQQFELLTGLDEKVIFEIFNALNHFETSKLEDRKFGRIFEYLVQKSLNESRFGYHFTPQPIAELFGNLVDTGDVTKVYDPCAGLGGLLTEINKQNRGESIDFFASDIDSTSAALGSLNLILNGIRKFEYIQEDCLLDPFHSKFDLIVSDLPLISRIGDGQNFSFLREFGLPQPHRTSGTATLILYILFKLKKGGKAYVTVPEGFLSRKGFDETTRRYIIDNGLLEAVISLPNNSLQPYTSLKISILCLTSENNKEVKFIDGTLTNDLPKEIGDVSNIENIVRSYKSKYSDSRISTVASTKEIIENEYILIVERYNELYNESRQLLEQGNAVQLEELVSIQGGITPMNIEENLDDDGPLKLWGQPKFRIIKTENLKKDILDLKLDIEDLSNLITTEKNFDRAVLRQKCLLIARIGENMKPTIFDPKDFDTPVIIHRGVYALIPRTESNISIEYLYYQFYSPFVQKQLITFKTGSTIPHLSLSNLNKVIIPVVDLQEQKKLVAAQRANLIQLERDKIEKRLELLGYEKEVADKESDIVRVLVHQLRPTFLSLNSQVEVIMRIVQNNKLDRFREFKDETPDFADPELLALGIAPNIPVNYTLKEICNKLLHDSKGINDKLTYVNKVMGFNLASDDFHEAPIKAFIEDHLKSLQVNNPLKFKIEVSGEECIVEFNKESMSELVDQLILNAQSHAYSENNISNFLRFNIKTSKQTPLAIVEYYNNGKDFKLTLEQFVSPFQKSQSSNGSGIGGYYIKRIVDAHNGTLLLNEKLKRGFGLAIELPIKQKLNSDE